jgi:hypothetical protein
MRDTVRAECPEDYLRKSITVPFLGYTLMKWKHARDTLGLHLVPSFNICSAVLILVSSELKLRFLWLRLCQVISLIVICWGLSWTITLGTKKSKLQMEYNKEDTSAAPGLVYVCFGSFVKYSRIWAIAGKNLIRLLFF